MTLRRRQAERGTGLPPDRPTARRRGSGAHRPDATGQANSERRPGRGGDGQRVVTIVSANVSSWPTATVLLKKCIGLANAVLVQESKVSSSDQQQEEHWAKGLGWSLAINPCLGSGVNASAGIATGCLGRHGLSHVDGYPGPHALSSRVSVLHCNIAIKGASSWPIPTSGTPRVGPIAIGRWR